MLNFSIIEGANFAKKLNKLQFSRDTSWPYLQISYGWLNLTIKKKSYLWDGYSPIPNFFKTLKMRTPIRVSYDAFPLYKL